jgi:hypothetical protein
MRWQCLRAHSLAVPLRCRTPRGPAASFCVLARSLPLLLLLGRRAARSCTGSACGSRWRRTARPRAPCGACWTSSRRRPAAAGASAGSALVVPGVVLFAFCLCLDPRFLSFVSSSFSVVRYGPGRHWRLCSALPTSPPPRLCSPSAVRRGSKTQTQWLSDIVASVHARGHAPVFQGSLQDCTAFAARLAATGSSVRRGSTRPVALRSLTAAVRAARGAPLRAVPRGGVRARPDEPAQRAAGRGGARAAQDGRARAGRRRAARRRGAGAHGRPQDHLGPVARNGGPQPCVRPLACRADTPVHSCWPLSCVG